MPPVELRRFIGDVQRVESLESLSDKHAVPLLQIGKLVPLGVTQLFCTEREELVETVLIGSRKHRF
jgi:hypothetical protein